MCLLSKKPHSVPFEVVAAGPAEGLFFPSHEIFLYFKVSCQELSSPALPHHFTNIRIRYEVKYQLGSHAIQIVCRLQNSQVI